MPADYAGCYRSTRRDLAALVRGLDDVDLARSVPATPDWAVRDAVSHVVGIAADLLDGNLDGVGSDAWTAAQVDARRGLPVVDVLDEWDERAPRLEEQVNGWPPEFAESLVGDLVLHDLDVRAALGRRDGRDTPGVAVALDSYARSLGDRLAERGLGSVRLDMPEGTRLVGEGQPAASVRASRFELLRALSGRRSDAQVRAYRWDGDPDAVVAVFAAYPMRETPLDE